MNSQEIIQLHQQSIINWKEHGVSLQADGFLRLVEENHSFNYQLWHEEDKARRDDLGFEFVYRAKRAIDGHNQQRNNRMESMDLWLYEKLKPQAPDACAVHSETPGMMIDRLSILALKSHHMAIQTKRLDVDEQHRQTCQQKLNVLHAQQKQLAKCLDELLLEVQKGSRTFVVYHQFKMYNDKTLNPELYQQ